MNNDRVEGKVKDVAGRVERQAGEWTGDPKKQVEGSAKQVEGKLQNAFGRVKDAAKNAADDAKTSSKPSQRGSGYRWRGVGRGAGISPLADHLEGPPHLSSDMHFPVQPQKQGGGRHKLSGTLLFVAERGKSPEVAITESVVG